MKVVEKVSWLMGHVQENLFPHLNQCLKTPLTAQEVIPMAPHEAERYKIRDLCTTLLFVIPVKTGIKEVVDNTEYRPSPV